MIVPRGCAPSRCGWWRLLFSVFVIQYKLCTVLSSKYPAHIAYLTCPPESGTAPPVAETLLTSIRSVILTTSVPEYLVFHIIQEQRDDAESIKAAVQRSLEQWQQRAPFRVHWWRIPPVSTETSLSSTENGGKSCSMSKFLLHEILPASVDRVLYLDTNTLVIDDIYHLWSSYLNLPSAASNWMVAMATAYPTDYPPALYLGSPSERTATVDHGDGSLYHSGVMMLNLKQSQSNPSWATPNTSLERVNLYTPVHENQVRTLSCRWNFRPEHCYYNAYCPDIEAPKAIGIVHGSRGVFHATNESSSPEPGTSVKAFSLLYQAFRDVTWEGTEDLGSPCWVSDTLQMLTGEWMKEISAKTVLRDKCHGVLLPEVMVALEKACVEYTQRQRTRKGKKLSQPATGSDEL